MGFHFRSVIAVGLSLCILAGPVLARDCQPATKLKLATVDAPQTDRDVLCAGVSLLERTSEASYTIRDYANLVSAAQGLRRAGYKSPVMYLELLPIAGIRPSSDLDLVVNAYAHSSGCVTPELFMQDMGNAITASKTMPDKRLAMQMFRSWDRNMFATYLTTLGADNACTFR